MESSQNAPFGPGKIKVLLVDDSAFIRMKIRNILKDRIEEAWECENGRDAVLEYSRLISRARKPDLVFMDMNMKPKNGLEASREILQMDAAARIIVVSSISDESHVRECLKLGVSDYIMKPFKDDKIRAVAENALGENDDKNP